MQNYDDGKISKIVLDENDDKEEDKMQRIRKNMIKKIRRVFNKTITFFKRIMLKSKEEIEK